MIEVPSILKYDILDAKIKKYIKYIILSYIITTGKASFHAEEPM